MRVLFTILLIFTLGFLLTATASEESDEVKTKYMVWELQLNPAQLEFTLDAIRAQNDFFRETNFPYSNFTQYTDAGLLWYTVEFTNYADIDQIIATVDQLWKDNPEISKELQLEFEGAYKSVGKMVLEHQPQLSFPPRAPFEVTSEKQFRFIEKCYLKRGKKEALEDVMKKYIKLRKRLKIKDSFYTLYPSFGADLSVVYFVDEMGSSPSDHYAKNAEIWNKFGKQGQNLWQELIQLFDKVEDYIGQADYDLMYLPEDQITTNQ